MTPETPEHEALCSRCGTSCHYGVPVNGLSVIVDDLHCTFLVRTDDGRFACSVYEDRFRQAPWCATAEEALEQGLLSQTCGYVAAARAKGPLAYRGKTRLHPRLEAKVLPAIRAEILARGAPAGVSLEGLRRFLARTGGGEFTVEEREGRFWLSPA